jgi:Uma2 family endonuclease
LRRMPDTAWVHLERWESLTPQEQAGIVPLAPDVAFELRSPSDQLEHL